jgi:hypothetical protein
LKEDGVALIVALMAMLLLSGLGLALVATTSSETVVAANFRSWAELSYAADAIAGRALADLHAVPDWTMALTGAAASTFVDGAPSGARTLADGTTINLTTIVNLANCNRTTACSEAAMNAATAARPWGANNPRWQLYAHGSLSRLLPAGVPPSAYGVAMVADDPAERDGDPLQDTSDPAGPGAGVLMLRVEVFGARGAQTRLELTVAHAPAVQGMHILTWRP